MVRAAGGYQGRGFLGGFRGRVWVVVPGSGRGSGVRSCIQASQGFWDRGGDRSGGGQGRGGWACQAQEYQNGPVQSEDILVVEVPDQRADLRFWHRGDLVDHQAARRPQSVARVRFDGQSKQGCLRRVGGEAADRDRCRGVEAVVLEDHHRPGLAGIVLAAGNAPDLAGPHSSSRSEMASMNA